jgi:hypothetical protein
MALDNIELNIAQLPGTDYLWTTYCTGSLPESFENILVKIRQRANSWQKHLICVQDLAISELKKKIIRYGVGGKNEFMDEFFALERTEYIKKFYENLYEYTPTFGSIEDCLGPSIWESELVKNSKLMETEKNWLDSALDITELDKSLNKSNFKSVPGRDGISNVFIRHFWSIFRKPLYDVAVRGLSAGALPGFFRSADIKLIPKKENTGEIKNWRPISLLSNFYKIVSRAINNRLKK